MFDELSFHHLAAGELKIITLHCSSDEEQRAWQSILKTLCYHKEYLVDKELRDGYDAVMKKVEQKLLSCKDDLSAHLNEHLSYRANVLMREIEKSDKGEKQDKKNVGYKSGDSKKNGEHIFHCAECNKGTCIFIVTTKGNITTKQPLNGMYAEDV